MRTVISGIVLILAFAALTMLLGWWAAPAVGAAWGLLANRRGAWRAAAVTAGIAWAVLLAASTRDALGLLASQLDGSLRVPGLVIAVLTLVFPAILAGSAAELAAVLRIVVEAGRRSRESRQSAGES